MPVRPRHPSTFQKVGVLAAAASGKEVTVPTDFVSPFAIAVLVAGALGYVAAVLAWATAQLTTARANVLVPGRCTSALALSYYARAAMSVTPSLLFFVLGSLFPSAIADGSGPGAKTAFYNAYGETVFESAIAQK